MADYKRVKRELVHQGQKVDIYNDFMQLPNKEIVIWDYIHHKGASAMLAIDEEGKFLMVKQYRNALERYTLEIPAGGINEGEDRKLAAIRECEEETGYYPEEVYWLLDLCTTVAFCNEKISIYCSNKLIQTKQNLDEDEFVSIERYSLQQLVNMILNGEIVDSKTIAAVLAYKTKFNL